MTSLRVYAHTNTKFANGGGIPTQDSGGWMKLRESFVVLALLCTSLLLIAGCKNSAAAITVQILPSGTISVDQGQLYNFTATVANDIHNQGVTWSLTSAASGCSGAGCGTLKNVTNSSVTYVAPTGLTTTESVTLTASAVSNPASTATATISVVLTPTFTTTGLPNAANGLPYNQTITVTGGVPPLTFSLQAGSSLPPGLILNSTGTIVGKPSVPGVNQPVLQSSFTVVVTDFGTPPLSVTEPYTISVTPPPALSIATTSLSTGLINSRYTASIFTNGGVAPLTWAVLPGTGAAPFNNLPTGLGLSTTSGQITGIIPAGTTAGTYNFVVQVQDSTLPSAQKIQAPLSIIVTAPPTLSISTTTLPNGTTGTAYNVPLVATGGIPPYTWSVTTGLLPSGLSLAPDGTITGVPVLATTAPDQFTVQVRDSEASPVTVSQALGISITGGSTNDNSLITGPYSFLFNGFDSAGSVAIAGSLTADGNGNITSGEEDSNRFSSSTGSAVVTGITLTGSYSLGTDGRGTMRLTATNPSNNVTLTTDYRIVVDSTGTIHFIQNNDITNATPPVIPTDTVGTHGEGIMKPVVGNFSAASFNGNYSFLFSGQDMSGKPAALAGTIHADGSASIIPAAGGVSSDFNDNGSLSQQNISGNFSVGSGNNRGTAELLLQIPGKSASELQFAFYFVSPSDIYFVEVDSTLNELSPVFYRLSGEMVAQISGYAFGASSLSGASVITGTGTSGSNASVLAGLLTSAGTGSATLAYDENNGGTITSPPPSFSGTYAAAGNGRVPFTGFTSGTQERMAVAYLTGPGQGFFLGSDAAVTTGLLEQQSAGPLGASSVQGGYTLSTSLPDDPLTTQVVGQVQVAPNAVPGVPGTITGTQTVDEIDPPSSGSPEGTAHLNQSLTAPINFIGTNGRGTASVSFPDIGIPANIIFYVVSPAHFRAISGDSNPGNGHPDVLFFDH